jgi:hypothetical protein
MRQIFKLNFAVRILEYKEWICTYTENTRNAQKVEYLGEFETKIENILGLLLGAKMSLFGQIT